MGQRDHLPGLSAVTQEQRLAQLLIEFGVVFNTIGHEPDSRGDGVAPRGQTILIETDAGPRNAGYPCFEVHFVFDEGGNFVQVGIWE